MNALLAPGKPARTPNVAVHPRALVSLLHPVWETNNNGEPADEAFVARCLLGAGWVGASRRLSMLDLRIWAALCGLLREQMPSAPEDDRSLDRASNRTVATTGYQLATWSTAKMAARTIG